MLDEEFLFFALSFPLQPILKLLFYSAISEGFRDAFYSAVTGQLHCENSCKSIKHTRTQGNYTAHPQKSARNWTWMRNDRFSSHTAAGTYGLWGWMWTGCLISRCRRYVLHRDWPAAEWRSWTQLQLQEPDPTLTVLVSTISSMLWYCWFNMLICLTEIIHMLKCTG